MEVRRFILATAGHVDHGKSALVKALTGADPDRLPEEKSRGITIDLGFAHLRLESPTMPNRIIEIDFIDVPGHEDFVRNMVAGTGAVDAALLVVAADDGWMPQTEEHLQILMYQGVRHGVVALTKADLRPNRQPIIEDIRRRLAGTALTAAPIVETAAITGQGLDSLRTALCDLFAGLSPQVDLGKPRLPIDRCFELKGVGIVVTGTLSGGSLRRGDSVVIQPAGIHARIRSLQTHNLDIDEALPGSRVGLNLVGADVRHDHIGRGGNVTMDCVGTPTSRFDVLLERLDRDSAGVARPLVNRSRAIVHHGTAWREANVQLLEQKELQAGGRALARLTISAPLLLLAGDCVILREASQRQTLAGGVVLDPQPPRSRRSGLSEKQLELLIARTNSQTDPATFIATQLARDSVAGIDDIGRLCRFSAAQLQSAAEHLRLDGRLRAVGGFFVDSGHYQSLIHAAADAIDQHHQHHPQDSGLPLVEIRKLARAAIPNGSVSALEAIVQNVIVELTSSGYVIPNGLAVIRRAAHIPRLPGRLQPIGQRILRQLAEHPFDPPPVCELAGDDSSKQALRFLIASGQVVQLDQNVFISCHAYIRAISTVCNHISVHGPTTVSQLKQALGSSRRVVVPLLEKMDKDHVTKRQGDVRVAVTPGAVLH